MTRLAPKPPNAEPTRCTWAVGSSDLMLRYHDPHPFVLSLSKHPSEASEG